MVLGFQGNTRNKKSGKPPEQNKISLKKSGIRNSERIKTLQAKQAEAKKKNDEARNYVHYNVRTAKGKFIPANKRYSSKSRTKPVKKQKTVSSNEMRKSSCHCRRNSGVDDVNGNRASDVETRDSEEDIVEISGDSSSVKYRAISRDSSKALSVLSELEKLATMPLDELLQSGASGELFRRPEMGPIGNSPIKETLFSNTRGVHRGGVWNSIVDESWDYSSVFNKVWNRADSRLAPSQWETLLQGNAVSHWLVANLESALWKDQDEYSR